MFTDRYALHAAHAISPTHFISIVVQNTIAWKSKQRKFRMSPIIAKS